MGRDLLPKAYEPAEIEKRWYAFWLENKLFRGNEGRTGKEYSIVIPPPNVTGSLHMGHALNNTLQDILIRYHRMNGYNTLWMPGMDHAGIATQNVVERQLGQEGLKREDLGREKFVERVWTWKDHSGGVIINQLKRLGCSCDWDRERFTMDEGLSRAVKEVFVRLYEEGLIYKGDYIVNWCPRCHTALSDLEVEHEDAKGNLWLIKYPVENSDEYLVVATTRPETMLGDTAVAVNPSDERYTDFVGKHAILPLVGRRLPIIADPIVAMEFGTGALKVTPSHDLTDFELSLRHNLERVTIMDSSGRINENGIHFQGMERYACRKAIVKELEEEGFLVGIEPYALGLGRCYRCKDVVEPLISKQWFVKVAPLAEQALKAVETGSTRIVPEHWTKTYFEWMRNIRDWCVSRQIWWGHRIPAWTCVDCGQVIVAREAPTECPGCKGSRLEQETDVLDTWFSSALWPFSTMGWPDDTALLKTFYPTSCLVTGFDILFFWVARMMMMGIKFMGDVPFKDVYIHALVRDELGKKMSKSLGNVIDPLMVMDKFGTDAFRFTLAALAAQGRDIRLSESRIEGYRNFMNKIWNAARFALPYVDHGNEGFLTELPEALSLPERWVLSRLNRTIQDVRTALENYCFNDAAQALYQFTWHEFCDWYIEEAKIPLSEAGSAGASRSASVLRHVLDALMRMLHPFIPFITEEIAQKLHGEGSTVMRGPFPEYQESRLDPEAEKSMGLLMGVISSVRNIRAEMNLPPGKALRVILNPVSDEEYGLMQANEPMIRSLGRISEMAVSASGSHAEPPRMSATAVVGEMRIFVPLEGIVDPDAEIARLTKEIAKVEKDMESIQKKLSNPAFVSKANPEAVQKQQDRQAELSAKLAGLSEGLAKMHSLKAS
ncbi:MAG TPA: valine--tRNA ligase [Desulfomonilaceae bacterium]|nr:valine--tRNA ligase [Desulfomonilaceae bacterium]